MSDCAPEGSSAEASGHPLGSLTPLDTADGSLSLHSSHFQEAFHSSAGALAEARAKFAQPAELQRFGPKTTLRVLDVCVGLGYNSAALMTELDQPRLAWWGLELDRRPLELALTQPSFRRLWPEPVLRRLEALQHQGAWQDSGSRGRLLWGDARQTLMQLPAQCRFDLILHDAFSPSLWLPKTERRAGGRGAVQPRRPRRRTVWGRPRRRSRSPLLAHQRRRC